MIERVVVKQLVSHLKDNHLSDKFQSAYRLCHSTEMALASVLNGILMALDQKQEVFLVLLDLSAAFDMVDHSILLKWLETRIGLRGLGLNCVSSYLFHHYQHVSASGGKSTSQELKRQVPQGSVVSLILFCIHTLPVGNIVKKYGIGYHLYVDDMQLPLSFNSCMPSSTHDAIIRLESSSAEIRVWMLANKLKLNGEKTELYAVPFQPPSQKAQA